jgi:hypothetical protein
LRKTLAPVYQNIARRALKWTPEIGPDVKV